jgi:predicted transcriptional regulator
MFSLRRLGKLERSVMEVVWRSDRELSVHDVHESLNRSVAYTTVMTTLDRLFKKGLLARGQSGRAYLYSSRMPRHQFAMELVSNLVEDIGEQDAALLDELERFVQERRRKLGG